MDEEKKELEVVEVKKIDYSGQLAGVDESLSTKIKAIFEPRDLEITDLQSRVVELRDMPNSKEKCELSSRIRKDCKKLRGEVKKDHKTAKQPYLLGSKAVDGVHNIFKLAISPIENEATENENYYIDLEKKIKDDIQKKREEKLLTLSPDIALPSFIRDMEDEEFQAYFSGQESLIEKKKQEEKEKADKDKKEKEISLLRDKRLKESKLLLSFIDNVDDIDFGTISGSEYQDKIKLAKIRKTESEASENEKMAKLEGIFEKRKSKIIELGFTYSENKEMFSLSDTEFTKSRIFNLDDNDFDLYFADLQKELKNIEKVDFFISELEKAGYEKKGGTFVKEELKISLNSLRALNKTEFKAQVKNNETIINNKKQAEADKLQKEKEAEDQRKLKLAPDKDKLKTFSSDLTAFLDNYSVELKNDDATSTLDFIKSQLKGSLAKFNKIVDTM